MAKKAVSERRRAHLSRAGSARREGARLCAAIVGDGKPCRVIAVRGAIYCRVHLGQGEGRPPPRVLSEPVADQIIADIELGMTLSRAASANGVLPETLYMWLGYGLQRREPYASFLDRVLRAEGSLLRRALGRFWESAGPRDVIELLSRRFPREFARDVVVRLDRVQKEIEETAGRDWMIQYLAQKGILRELEQEGSDESD